MKIKYRVALELIIEGKDKQEIADKFMDLNLGALDHEAEVNGKNPLVSWDYIETEQCNLITDRGYVGEEILQP